MIKGRININRILLASLLFLLSFSLSAGTDNLHRQLNLFIEQQVRPQLLADDIFSYQIDPINDNQPVLDCQAPYLFEPLRPLQAGSFSIRVSCEAPRYWSFYVRGNIHIGRNVIVAAQALPRGTSLRPEMLQQKRVSADSLNRGYYSHAEDVYDFELRRAVSKGRVITAQILNPPLLVKKGDHVIISAGLDRGVEVRVDGIALQDGRLNQQIRVENITSGRQIRARVADRGLVRADY